MELNGARARLKCHAANGTNAWSAQDCAKSWDATSTCGVSFYSVAVQPYFRENIYKNFPPGEAFWRFEKKSLSQSCSGARWIVLPTCCTFDSAKQQFDQDDRYLRSVGYVPVHISKGSIFFEGREVSLNDFVIYWAAGPK